VTTSNSFDDNSHCKFNQVKVIINLLQGGFKIFFSGGVGGNVSNPKSFSGGYEIFGTSQLITQIEECQNIP